MTYYMCFIQTLTIRCTVSEILAEIDHKDPNGIGFTIKKLYDVINLGRTSLLRNNINNYEKMGQT